MILWDYKKKVQIGEVNVQRDILKLKLFSDLCIICCLDAIYFFNPSNSTEPIEKFSTSHNPYGLIAIEPSSNGLFIAYPDHERIGTVCVYNRKTKEYLKIDAFDKEIRYITMKETNNNNNKLPATSISNDNNVIGNGVVVSNHSSSSSSSSIHNSNNNNNILLAAADENGTIIRVFNVTAGGVLIKSFNRGHYEAWIYSIAFSHDGGRLACTSSRGTIHVFDLLATKYDYIISSSATHTHSHYFFIC